MASRDADAAAPLAGDSSTSADLLRTVVANAESLDVADFTLRYVDETSSTSADGTWTAAVDMTWRFAGFDREPVREEVLVAFDGTGPGATVTGIGGGDRRTPLWLTSPLEVRRAADSLVLVAGSAEDADRFAAPGGRRRARRPRRPAGLARRPRRGGARQCVGAGRDAGGRAGHLRQHRRGLGHGRRHADPDLARPRLRQPRPLHATSVRWGSRSS